MSLTIDSARWRIALDRLRNVTRQHMRDFVTDQFRLLLEQIMKFTPPNNRAQGRARVKADILKVFRPFDTAGTTNKRLLEIVRAGDQRAFDAFARNAKHPWRAGTFSAAAHAKARDRRGRVNRSGKYAPYVLGRAQGRELAQYVKDKQANVGIARAGWSPALQRVGGSIPSWVARHGMKYGDVIDRRNVMDNPTLLAINRTPWANRQDEGVRIIGEAMKSRTRRLETALRVQLRLVAQKSGFAA